MTSFGWDFLISTCNLNWYPNSWSKSIPIMFISSAFKLISSIGCLNFLTGTKSTCSRPGWGQLMGSQWERPVRIVTNYFSSLSILFLFIFCCTKHSLNILESHFSIFLNSVFLPTITLIWNTSFLKVLWGKRWMWHLYARFRVFYMFGWMTSIFLFMRGVIKALENKT